MAGTPEQLAEARKLIKHRGRKPGSKNKETIALEKAYEVWAQKALANLDSITKVQIEQALEGKSFQERKDVLDRLIGKPKDKVEISGPEGGAIELSLHVREAIRKVYGGADEGGSGEPSQDGA